jgi:hypothetical protein
LKSFVGCRLYLASHPRKISLSLGEQDVALFADASADARYVFTNSRAAALQAMRSVGSLVTITLYEPGDLGGSGVLPYLFIVVAEERERNRWVGAPAKFCHAASFELGFTVRSAAAAAASAAAAGPSAVLMLALRDCRIPRQRPPRVPSQGELQGLLNVVLGASSVTDLHSSEFPAGRAFL